MRWGGTNGGMTAGAFALAVFFSFDAAAADIRWKDAVSGSWTDASKWEPAQVPGASDNAILDATGAAYTVNVGPSRTVGSIDVASSDATLYINGSPGNGHVTLTTTNGLTVSGALLFQNVSGGYACNLNAGTGLVVNSGGSVNVAGGGGARDIAGPITNDGSITFNVNSTLNGAGVTFLNRGDWTVSSGVTLAMTGGSQVFEQRGGTITRQGLMHLDGGRFENLGGTVTSWIYLRSSALVMDPGATGTAYFILGNGSTLQGTITPAQTVMVRGANFTDHTTATASGPVVVEGVLRMDTINAGYNTNLNMGSHLLTIADGGTFESIDSEGRNGARNLWGSVRNEGSALFERDTTMDTDGAVYQNLGVWRVESGSTLAMTGVGHRFEQLGGVVQRVGLFHLDDGRFENLGGDVTGSLYLRGTDLLLSPTATGTGTFILGNGSTFAGTIGTEQQVLIRGQNFTGHTTVTAAGPVTVQGLLRLDTLDQGFNTNLNMGVYPLTVAQGGEFRWENSQGRSGSRDFKGDVTNYGTFETQLTTTFTKTGAVYENYGTWRHTAGTLQMFTGADQTFRQEAGTFERTGGTVHLDDGRWEQNGGAVTSWIYLRGTDLVIDSDGSDQGTGRWILGNGSTLGGTIHPDQQVLIRGQNFTGHTTVFASAPVLVDGLLRMDTLDQGFNTNLNMGSHLLTVASGGQFVWDNSESRSGGRDFKGDVVNHGSFTTNLSANFTKTDAVYENHGTWTHTAGTLAFVTGGNQIFKQEAGDFVRSAGTVHLDDGRWEHNGGTASSWIYLRGTDLVIDGDGSDQGTGRWILGNGSTIGGTIHPDQQVLIRGQNFTGHTTVTASAPVLVEGRLLMDTLNQGFATNLNMGAHLLAIANGGEFVWDNSEGRSGARDFKGDVVNHGSFTTNLSANFTKANAVYENYGTWTHTAGTLAFVTGSGQTFRQQEGAFVRSGGTVHLDDGRWEQNGGSASSWVYLRGTDLIVDSDPSDQGTGLWILGNGSTIAGTIHPPQQVLIRGQNFTGHTTVQPGGDVLVNGTVRLDTLNQNWNTDWNLGTTTLTIGEGGQLLSQNSESRGGPRTITGVVDNNGRIEAHRGTTFASLVRNLPTGRLGGTSTLNFNGGLNNSGWVSPGTPAGHGTVTINGTDRDAPGLEVKIGGMTVGTQYDRAAFAGTVNLSGVLRVSLDDGYLPNQGDTFTVLTSTGRSGTFDAFEGLEFGQSSTFLVSYNANNVVLTAAQIPSFEVTFSEQPTAGVPFDLTVEARDELDVLDPTYQGTVILTSSDLGATLDPLTYTFDAVDNGVHVFTGLVLRDAGPQSITVTDVDDPVRRRTASTAVLPAPLSASDTLVFASPQTVEANGFSFSTITVVPRDTFGNDVGPGKTVSLNADLGTLEGAVADVGDGTYTQVLRSPTSIGTATVSASASAGQVAIDQTATVSFVADTSAPASVQLSLNGTTGQTADLAWTASSSPDVTGYRVLVEQQDGTALFTVDAGAALSTTVVSLPECTDVRLAVQPYDAAGNYALRSSWVSLTTERDGAPEAPTGMTADAQDSYVALGYSPSPSCDVVAYRVQRAGASGGPYSTVLELDPMTLSGFDTVVDNGTPYYYVTVAVDGEGNEGAPTGEVTATPQDGPDADPLAGLVAAGVAGGVIELTWVPPATGDLLHYRVYRDAAPITDVSLATVVAEPVDASFDDLPDSDGTYHYAVTWLDVGGNESTPTPSVPATSDRAAPVGTLVFDNTPPLIVGGQAFTFTLDEDSTTAPTLTYTAPDGSETQVTLTQDGATSTLYTGTVDVVDGSGEGTGAFALAATDALGNDQAQVVGGLVSVDGVRPTAIVVTAPVSPVNAGVVSVTLTASEPLQQAPTLDFTPAGGAAETIALTDAAPEYTGSFTVDETTPDGTGAFSVALVDAAGNTGDVITAGAALVVDSTPPSPPENVVASVAQLGALRVTWQAGPGGASSYRLFRSASAIDDVQGLQPLYVGTTASYEDLPPAEGEWFYVVTAIDEAGNQSAPSLNASAVSDQTPPGAPTALNGSADDTGVTLGWTPPGGEVPLGYNLYRATATFAGDVSAASPVAAGVATTGFLDRPSAEGTYFYVVTAVDAVGFESAPSNEIEVPYDALAPRIVITGVSDSLHARTSVTPVITFEDANLDPNASEIILDGAAFVSGTAVTAEGDHTLFVAAEDTLGHRAERTVVFTLDFTAPVVTVSGVSEGQLYNDPPVPVIEAEDDHLLQISTTLNGQPFASGTPVQTDGNYELVATARDRAGNITTETVSFVVDVPPRPVPTVHADVSDEGVVLSWGGSPSGDVQQYIVRRNGDAIYLGSSTTAAGGALPEAPENARFEVEAIDALGQRSAARVLTVHPLKLRLVQVGTALADGSSALTRGAFDLVELSVANDDLIPHAVGPATVTLTNVEGTELWTGDTPDEVDAPAQAGTPLPLTVYSHTELSPAGNELRVQVDIESDPVASVTWDQTYLVDMRFSPGRALEPVFDQLIRGSEAQIRMRATNFGSAPLQLVSADNASTASSELFVRMRDPDPQGFKAEARVDDAPAGTQMSDNRFVSSIAPGLSRTFAPVSLVIPNEAPDNSVLELEATKIHTGYDTPGQLTEDGYIVVEGVEQGFYDQGTVSVVPPPYLVTATTDKPEYTQGELVMISGVATDTETGAPVADAIVKLLVSQGGFDQKFYARTDAAGLYSYPFFASFEVAGVFNVSATHPIVVVKEADASFVVHGLRMDPGTFNLSLSKNASYPVAITLRNTGETTATGLTAAVSDATTNAGVTAALRDAAPTTLAPKTSVTLVVDVTAAAVADDQAAFDLTVTSDQGITRTTRIAIDLFAAAPSPDVSPRFLDVALVAGEVDTRTVTVTNRGYGAWESVVIAPPTDPTYLNVTTALDVGNVEPGEAFSFDVFWNPEASAPSAVTNSTIFLESDNLQQIPVNVTTTVTTDAVGDVEVNVHNVIYDLDPNNPDYPIGGALVRLQSQDVFTSVYRGTTDGTGQLVLADVPAGRYGYVVTKSGFNAVDSVANTAESGTLVVEPATTTTVEVGMVETIVDVDWSVTPVTISDSYDVTLETTYETTVPTPVVETVPANQTFDMTPGAVRSGQLELVNLGVISAFDVKLTLAQDHYLDIQLAFDRIAEIPAQSRVVVPFTVHLKTHASPPPTPCTTFNATVDVDFEWWCETAGRWLPGASLGGSVDVQSHAADVRVEPNTIVRQTFYNCPGFEDGEGVTPPGVNVSNGDGGDVDICDCGRMTTNGIGLPTLDSLLDELESKVQGELGKLGDRVQQDLGLPDPPDFDQAFDAATDAAGQAAYGDDWPAIKQAGQKMNDAYEQAQQAQQEIQDALDYIGNNTCEQQTTSQNISSLVASIGAEVGSQVVNNVLDKYTGGLLKFSSVHTRFDQTCMAAGDSSTAEIPAQSSSFGVGTMNFSVAKGCGENRTGSCCPVSVGFVDYTVICTDTGISSTQSGGGPTGGSSWGGWTGGSVGGGGGTGTSEGICER